VVVRAPGRQVPDLHARALLVLNLRWRDLDLEGGFYRYIGKDGKERQRALPPPARLAILLYAQVADLERRPEEAAFPGRWRDQPVDGKYISINSS
jgi:integrase